MLGSARKTSDIDKAMVFKDASRKCSEETGKECIARMPRKEQMDISSPSHAALTHTTGSVHPSQFL